MKKSKAARPPRRRPTAEIIVKETFQIDGRGRRPKAEPVLHILANREGYRWLADCFRFLADRPISSNVIDPDDHQHLDIGDEPFNERLSDKIEFRLSYLTHENRRAALDKYEIAPRTARKGCLTGRYGDLICEARRHL